MKILGCDLHAKQQTIAMVDTETGEFTEKTLSHEGNEVREFYAALEGPVVVGIEATGAMQWFLELLEELGMECRVGHPGKIRAKETRQQKHDPRDGRVVLELAAGDRLPESWKPSNEQRGVGAVTALATEVFLGDPSRFATANQVASYIGMIPCEHTSGKRQRLGKLTKEGNSLLRYLWTEATLHAVRKDPALKRFYRRKLIQKGMGKARIAAAHKLGIRLWIMLRDQIDYKEFCRRGQQRQCGEAHAGMPNYNSGPALQ